MKLVLIVSGIILLSGLIYLLPLKLIFTTSASDNWSFNLNNGKDLQSFLNKAHFWDRKIGVITGKSKVKRRVKVLRVSYAPTPQSQNTEEYEGKIIGSVGTEYKWGLLTVYLQSDPSIWTSVDRNQHLQDQFIRFINEVVEIQFRREDAGLFREYGKGNKFFYLHEK